MPDILLIPVPEAVLLAYLPVFACLVPAGFPSPTNDHVEALFDLNYLLFCHPGATYLVATRCSPAKLRKFFTFSILRIHL